MSSQHHYTLSENPTNLTTNSTNTTLTFNDISNYFHLPLSDAASTLGTCTSVLKKICHDNGLDRWPYRKILAGKSVEDVKRYAAREKHRKLVRPSIIGKQSGLQLHKNNLSKTQGTTPHHSLQEQGSKSVQNLQAQSWLSTSLKGLTVLDEFKYGFPSDGLAVVSNRWWGSLSPDGNGGISREGADLEEEKEQTAGTVEDGASSLVTDEEKADTEKEKINTSSKGAGLLTDVRKKIVEEGREALKLGVYRGTGVHKIGRKERKLLFQIFGSSLPKQWIDGLP